MADPRSNTSSVWPIRHLPAPTIRAAAHGRRIASARLVRRSLCGLAAALATACTPALALAYTVESAATEGCHERITSEALRRVRETSAAAAPIEPDEDERALVADLQFVPEDDMRDVGAVTLLLGVRDNDLKGRGAQDLTSLALVHGDPDTQDEHCLRGLNDDEPNGSGRAITACRAYIEKRVGQAIAGLDAEGRPSDRMKLPIHLAVRNDVAADLPTFYVRMGQALHALEDGFSHTYRTEDGRTVTVALNWLDVVGETHEESRDGPGHSEALDACDDADDLRTLRRELATDASAELLHAALAPGRTDEEKMNDVRAVLDTYLGYQPGCTPDNKWCDAAEARIPAPGCGCTVVGQEPASKGTAAIVVAGAIAFVAARARRRTSRRGALAACAAVALALASAAGPARAQVAPPAASTAAAPAAPPGTPPPAATPPGTPPPEGAPSSVTTSVIPGSTPAAPPTTATQVVTPGAVTTTVTAPRVEDEKAPPPPNIVPVEEPGPTDPTATTWGFALTGAGAVDKAAVAGALGLRLRISKRWAFGLDGEWNPFLALSGEEPVRTGALNIYGSAFLRLPLAYEAFNIRSQLSLGTSTLLFDLYGAPSGSTGIYLGLNPIGVEYKATDWFYLVINPIGIAVPVPQISGLPFLYPQYRLSLAVEFYAG